MTLQELTSDNLKALEKSAGESVLKKLLQSRLEDIRNDDFSMPVKDVDGMLKREYNRGMYAAYEAIAKLGDAVKEEYELREQESALADENKK